MTSSPSIAAASLADLADRINAEHQAVCGGARTTLQHAINAGNLLIEAKTKLSQHGRWLPWLDQQLSEYQRAHSAELHAPCPERSERDGGKSAVHCGFEHKRRDRPTIQTGYPAQPRPRNELPCHEAWSRESWPRSGDFAR